jgi:hypothetical protein
MSRDGNGPCNNLVDLACQVPIHFTTPTDIVFASMSLPDDNTEPPASPFPSNGCEAVEVTGVLAITAFSTRVDFDPEWSLTQVANDLCGRLSDNTQQLLKLNLPLGLCELNIFKCMCCTAYFDRLSHLLLIIISAVASVQLFGGFQKSITDVEGDEKEEVKFLIMFDLPSDQANIMETYIKDNKENITIAHGDCLVKEEDESKGKNRKGKKKSRAGK